MFTYKDIFLFLIKSVGNLVKVRDENFEMLVVIGASAGGLSSLQKLLPQLYPEDNYPVLVVWHLSKDFNQEAYIRKLQNNTKFLCKLAEHEEEIKSGTIYFPASNRHILVKEGKILLGDGPPENRWRPSIDSLFRSAAVYYGAKTTGIICSGLLYDGVAGMSAIKKCGGTCIVQDPKEAEFKDMPEAVINHVQADHIVSVTEMGRIIHSLAESPYKTIGEIPENLKIEAKIAENVYTQLDEVSKLGSLSSFTCPDCGGNLFEIDDGSGALQVLYRSQLYGRSTVKHNFLKSGINIMDSLANNGGKVSAYNQTQRTKRKKIFDQNSRK